MTHLLRMKALAKPLKIEDGFLASCFLDSWHRYTCDIHSHLLFPPVEYARVVVCNLSSTILFLLFVT